MDIKETYAKKSLADNDEQAEFQSSATSTAQTQKKDGLDFTKTDASTSRPCAVIAPESQNKQQLNSPTEIWNEQAAFYKSHTSSGPVEHSFPSRNISPRQTFQENMPRIMLPPRMETHKPAIDPYSSGYIKQTSKYCEVPYLMNTTLSDHGKEVYMVPETTTPRGYPHYPPSYHPPQIRLDYQCSLSSVPCNKTASSKPEDIPQVYKDSYYRGANIRFEPYAALKEKYPRYDFSNIPHPYAAHAYSLPPNMKQVNHSYVNYDPSHRYLDPKLADINKDYSKSASGEAPYVYNTNAKYSSSHSRSPYYSRLSYPIDNDPRSVGRPPYIQNRNNLDYDRMRECPYPPVYHNIRGRLPPNYPVINSMNRPQNNMRNNKLVDTEYLPSKNFDRYHNMYNPLANIPTQFSPNVISPSDSIESEGVLNSSSHEDSGYLSQCSTVSSKSLDNQRHNSYNYQVGPYSSHHHLGRNYTQKYEKSKLGKDKLISLRSYIENWDEGFEETAEDLAKTQNQIVKNPAQPQLVVLDAINIPQEELAKYQHIQRINKLPDNIRGFDNNELLKQFEKATGESQEKDLMTFKLNPVEVNKNMKPLMTCSSPVHRSTSPLDFEAKISQSVIRKELKFNFEIRPCTPSRINTASMQAQHMQMLSKMDYEKKALQNTNNLYQQIHSNQMIPQTTPENTYHPLNKPCNSKIPKLSPINVNPVVSSLNENCGTVSNICFASLPRLDADIELNIPEINQQYENQNYGTVITNVINQHNKNEFSNHLTPSILHSEKLATKVDLQQNYNPITTVLSPASSGDFASDKISTSKLSKFRIHKNSTIGSKETSPTFASSSIPQRVDSVIIKPCDKSPTATDGASLLTQRKTASPNSLKLSKNCENRFEEISINEAINLSLHSNELEDISNFNNKQLDINSHMLQKTEISESDKNKGEQSINNDKISENDNLNDIEAENTMNIVEDGLKKIFEVTNEETLSVEKSNFCLDLSICASHTNSPMSESLTQGQESRPIDASTCDNRINGILTSDKEKENNAPTAGKKYNNEYPQQSSSFSNNCDIIIEAMNDDNLEAMNNDNLAAKNGLRNMENIIEENSCHEGEVLNDIRNSDTSSSDSESSSESSSSSGSEYSRIESPKQKIDNLKTIDFLEERIVAYADEKQPILSNSSLHISKNNTLNVTLSDSKITLKPEMKFDSTSQNNDVESKVESSKVELNNKDNFSTFKTEENLKLHEPHMESAGNQNSLESHAVLGVFKLDSIVEPNDIISINKTYKHTNIESYACKITEYDKNSIVNINYASDIEASQNKDFESNTNSSKIEQELVMGIEMKITPLNVGKHPECKINANIDLLAETQHFKKEEEPVYEPKKDKIEIESFESQKECYVFSEKHNHDSCIGHVSIANIVNTAMDEIDDKSRKKEKCGSNFQANENIHVGVEFENGKNNLQNDQNSIIEVSTQIDIQRDFLLHTQEESIISSLSDSDSTKIYAGFKVESEINSSANIENANAVHKNMEENCIDTSNQVDPVKSNLKAESLFTKLLKACEVDTILSSKIIASSEVDNTLSSEIEESVEVDAKCVSVNVSNNGDVDGSKTDVTEKCFYSSNESKINPIVISKCLNEKDLNSNIEVSTQIDIQRDFLLPTQEENIMSSASDSDSTQVSVGFKVESDINSSANKKNMDAVYESMKDSCIDTSNQEDPVKSNLKAESFSPKSLKTCAVDIILSSKIIESFEVDNALSSKIEESVEVDAKFVSINVSNNGEVDGSNTDVTEKCFYSSNESKINPTVISECLFIDVENTTNAPTPETSLMDLTSEISLPNSEEEKAFCEKSKIETSYQECTEINHTDSNHESWNIVESQKPEVDIVSIKQENSSVPCQNERKFYMSNDTQVLDSKVECNSTLANKNDNDETAIQILQPNEEEKNTALQEASKRESNERQPPYGVDNENLNATQLCMNDEDSQITENTNKKEEIFGNSSISQPYSDSGVADLNQDPNHETASDGDNAGISLDTTQIGNERVMEPIIEIKSNVSCSLKRCSIVAYSESSESEDENENTKIALKSAKIKDIITPNDDNLQHCVNIILKKPELNEEPKKNNVDIYSNLDYIQSDEIDGKKVTESNDLQVQEDIVLLKNNSIKFQNDKDSITALDVVKDDKCEIFLSKNCNNHEDKNLFSKKVRPLKRSKSHDSFLENDFKDKTNRETGSKSVIECFSGYKKRKVKRNMLYNISDKLQKVYLATSNSDRNVYMEADSTQSGYERLEGEICKSISPDFVLEEKEVSFNKESSLKPIIESEENPHIVEEVFQDQYVVLHNNESIPENISYIPNEKSELFQDYVIEDTNDIWLDNVACVETVVSENADELEEQHSDPFDQYANEMQTDLEKLKELCSSHNNINALETLFRTPGTDVSSKLVSELLESFEKEENGCFNVQTCEDSFDQHENDSSDPISGSESEGNTDIQDESSKLYRAETVASSEGPPKTLITKAAQKYIPPLKVKLIKLPVKIPMSPEKLNHYRLIKEIKPRKDLPEIKISSTKHVHREQCSVKDDITPKKSKPNFEDVMLTIDRTMKVNLLTQHKVRRKSIPKMLIKKTENGSHYSTSIPKPVSSPDLTGNKWQPWVCLKKDEFIEKMVAKNKRRAIYCPRTHRFAILHPKIVPKVVKKTVEEYYKEKNDSSLKYTIKLNNHSYINRFIIKGNYTNR